MMNYDVYKIVEAMALLRPTGMIFPMFGIQVCEKLERLIQSLEVRYNDQMEIESRIESESGPIRGAKASVFIHGRLLKAKEYLAIFREHDSYTFNLTIHDLREMEIA